MLARPLDERRHRERDHEDEADAEERAQREQTLPHPGPRAGRSGCRLHVPHSIERLLQLAEDAGYREEERRQARDAGDVADTGCRVRVVDDGLHDLATLGADQPLDLRDEVLLRALAREGRDPEQQDQQGRHPEGRVIGERGRERHRVVVDELVDGLLGDVPHGSDPAHAALRCKRRAPTRAPRLRARRARPTRRDAALCRTRRVGPGADPASTYGPFALNCSDVFTSAVEYVASQH